MSDVPVRVDFEALPWQSPARGLRFKAVVRKQQQLRLIELSSGYAEATWCTRGHAFHVLEGALTIETEHGRTCLAAGDVGALEEGQKHKASVSGEERALLLLFELP